MTYREFACYFLLEGIAVWMLAIRYERWSHARYCEAMRRIRGKYSAHKDTTERL